MRTLERYGVFNLSGAYDFITKIIEQDLPVMKPYTKKLKTIRSYMDSIFKDLIESNSDKEVQKILTAADEYTYQVVRKSVGKGNPHYSVVNLADNEYIINEAVKYVCLGCDKSKQQAKECRFRQAIESEGMLATSSLYDNCPFCW